MESRFRVLFLIGALMLLSGCANLFGREEAPPPSAEAPGQVVDPQVERREIKEPKIDTENFELGVDDNHWHVYVNGESFGMVMGTNTDQVIRNLGQHELPDNWLKHGNPWEIDRPEQANLE